MVREAIILAGGIGTRLGSILKGVPKPMADISGRPFLEYLLDLICPQNIKRVILAVGYRHEAIRKHFGETYKGVELIFSVEDEPLGTGGAIKKALDLVEQDDFFILNGDSYFDVSLPKLHGFHTSKGAVLSVALKPLTDCSRYGTVEVNGCGRIVGFKEKGYQKKGMINGGIYITKKTVLRKARLPVKFSFEKDFLEKCNRIYPFYGLPFSDCFFIDIGISEDYARAQKVLKKEAKKLLCGGVTH